MFVLFVWCYRDRDIIFEEGNDADRKIFFPLKGAFLVAMRGKCMHVEVQIRKVEFDAD